MSAPVRQLTRRSMLGRAAHTAALIAGTTRLQLSAAAAAPGMPGKPLIWDAHAHLTGVKGTPEERIRQLLHYADRVGVDRVIFFLGFSRLHDPPPDQVRRDNDELLRAIEQAPGRAFGFVYLNPKHVEESIEEFDRCVTNGPMVGIKLWVATRCNDVRLDPIVAHAARHKAPILQHIWQKATGNLPGESIPSDLAELAGRHPDATFLGAHLGGDWEPGIRALRASRNVVAELSGFDPTAGVTEMAVRELGPERVVFGSDYGGRSLASQLAKVTGADISDVDKRLILGGEHPQDPDPHLPGKGNRVVIPLALAP